jgi:hypothetical protein
MSHCPLLTAARPEQPPGTAPNCPHQPLSSSLQGGTGPSGPRCRFGRRLVTFFFLAGWYGRTGSPSVAPVNSVRRFWRASTWLLVSCPLLRGARSRSSGAAAATICTLRQVTRHWHSAWLPSSMGASVVASALRSSAASNSANLAYCPSICPSRATT